VADKNNQFPTVVVLVRAAPCRHSRESDAVVNDVVDFPVREVLCIRLAHLWRLGVEVLSNFSFPASVIAVARGAVVREMGPCFAENFSGRHKGILGIPLAGMASLRAVFAM
jgi:hypothetical protein